MDDFQQMDISTEEIRWYHYAGGESFRIDKPATLFRKSDERGDSHRVLDAVGVTHCPRRGWLAISWRAPGAPVSF